MRFHGTPRPLRLNHTNPNMLMRPFSRVITLVSLLALSGCGKPAIKADLTTPEGAILLYEDACRKGDIEKAVACKDFKVEAAYMMHSQTNWAALSGDPEVLAKVAETLELAYRAQMKQGFPDFAGVTSTFPKKRDFDDSKVVVTEVCRFRDGATETQDILVAKTEAGWKMMIPLK